MTEQPPSAEALNLVDRLRKPLHPPDTYWHELNLLDAGRAIDALIAQRVSAAIAERDKSVLELVRGARARDERPAPEGPSAVEAYVKGPLPDCMMPDGGEACKAYQLLHAAFAQAETEAFLRGREVGEKYGHLDSSAPPALASTGEQPASPAAVVNYTERARLVLDRWCGSHLHHFIPVDSSKGEDPAAYLELHGLIRDALSAVASERDAAPIRAFGQRVWSDTEEIAYQAGVSDTRERLGEPDVREAVIDALMTTTGWVSSFPGKLPLVSAALADAALAKIAEMLR